MKYIIVCFTLLSTAIFSQTVSNQSFYEFKQSTIEKIEGDQPVSSKNMSSDVKSGRKNTGLAILYSLLLPGMGELYAESYSSGMYFTIAEGVLWGTYIGMNTYAGWQEDRYKSFAVTKAGIIEAGKDNEFYSRIGVYSNLEQYNNEKALERNFDQMYNSQQFYWKWNSTEERRTYRDMWLSSEQTKNDIRFVVGAMIINRLASAVNAVRMVSAYNRRLEDQSWNVSVGLVNYPNLPTTLNLNFNTTF
ncbi:MAG: hypothetical protein R6W68_15040 [Ignavibacteriaceae bacterium]